MEYTDLQLLKNSNAPAGKMKVPYGVSAESCSGLETRNINVCLWEVEQEIA